MMNSGTVVLVGLLAASSVVCSAPLVRNADFTERVAGNPAAPAAWQMEADKGWQDTDEDGMSGQHSMRYLSRVEQAAPPVTQKVACQPNTEYVLTAALKSVGSLQPAVRVRDNAAEGKTLAQVTAPKQPGPWRRYSSKFNSGTATALVIELWADVRHVKGEPAPAGTCGIDDVQVQPAAEVSGAADETKTAKYENAAKGKPYALSTPPNYALCTDGEDTVQLTDGVYTVGYFWTQKSTVGWQGRRPILVTIDLGKVEPIRGVSYNTAAGVAQVEWPISVLVLVSDDGKTYHSLGDLVAMSDAREAPSAEGYAIHRYWVDDLKTHGRFVQLVLDSGGGYCFVDEIEVYRGEEAWTTLPFEGEAVTDGATYFRNVLLNTAVKRRLNADLWETRGLVQAEGPEAKVLQAVSQELANVEKAIAQLPPVDPATFRAVFPINDLHARLFAARGKVRQALGRPALEAWVCHPLDYVTPYQTPPENQPPKLSAAMMRGEWRSAVLNLTSSAGTPITANLRIEGLPGGPNPGWVTVHEVQWTDTKELKPIGVALPEAQRQESGYVIRIPAGMTRQVWLTFHPVSLKPGTHSGQVVVTWPGGRPVSVPLAVRLFPMTFPQQPTLHVGGWDYTDADAMYGVTLENRDALIAHLKEHFVDSPWGTSAVLPWGPADAFDAEGNLTKPIDTSNFDKWIARWPQARRYCVFVSLSDSIMGATIGTPRFNAIAGSWINYWVKHAETRGISPDRLVLLLLDEPSQNDQDRIILAWAKAIRSAQPKVVLWEDPTYVKPWEAVPEMMASLDVLCPNRIHLLNGGKEFEDFYRKQKAEGRRLDFYSCSGPMHLLDPYSYVRLQAWTCWDMGAESTFFWAFGDSGGGNPWNPYDTPGNNYAPMFLAPDSVTPGKHMEAIRESAEDYEYFVMLKDAIAKAKPNHPALPKAKELLATGARRVLDAPDANKISWLDPKDRWVAETVRSEVLETLAALAK